MLDPSLTYLAVAAVCIGVYLFFRHRSSRLNQTMQQEARSSGRHEPASLYPRIDPGRCIGCGSCVTACPEKSVLGLINNKSELIEAANCIGHGACREACPVGAITLVFGTASRGVDIPHIRPNFETNVGGIYIAGELGGMGLIRNAVEQGRQAVENITASLQAKAGTAELELLIVGAGPAGIAASLTAKHRNLRYLTIDQDSLGGTVAHFPRRKIVMTRPVQLPLAGKVQFRETTKESLIEFWEGIVGKYSLNLRFGVRMEGIEPQPDGLRVVTDKGEFLAGAVLLCLGRRGSPRKLDVPGEELTKVVYRLIDAEQYRNQKVLVVGGGDSAVEAATSIAAEPGTEVTLAYRGKAFNRIKPGNRESLDRAVSDGVLRLMLETEVDLIEVDHVALRQHDKRLEIGNDAVIVCAGGVLPNALLERIGIQMETKYGTA